VDVLTGFKYIGEQIALLEEKNSAESYLLGFEESYGYLCSPFVRDKDGVSTSVLICEMANFYRTEGKTLADRLDELYAEFGAYRNSVVSFAFEGSAGMDKMKSIMENLRNNPPREMLGRKLICFNDYLKSESRTDDGKQKEDTRLEYFGLSDNGKYYMFSLRMYTVTAPDSPAQGAEYITDFNNFAVPREMNEVLREFDENRSPEHQKAYLKALVD
jgi:hypothetical protein